MALCVLDLAGLPGLLERENSTTARRSSNGCKTTPNGGACYLSNWHEVNQVALQLLGISFGQEAWIKLINGCPANPSAIGYQLAEAVLEQQHQLELEITLTDAQGHDQHLWLVLRSPEDRQDYHAVILSISGTLSPKLIELSLQERESFWSDVVRTVPDHLYVQNVISQRMIFSNHHLGQTLGYSSVELQQMGPYFWELLLHPEDAEHYSQQQRDGGYAWSNPIANLRFRHHSAWRQL